MLNLNNGVGWIYLIGNSREPFGDWIWRLIEKGVDGFEIHLIVDFNSRPGAVNP